MEPQRGEGHGHTTSLVRAENQKHEGVARMGCIALLQALREQSSSAGDLEDSKTVAGRRWRNT